MRIIFLRFLQPGLLLSGLLLISVPVGRLAATPKDDLPPRYDKWLKEDVVYLINPEEKKIFLGLKTDVEREVFIRNFWARLDPLPLTPGNEFKEEHDRRLAHAREQYGLRSDRGRIHILLGAPESIDREPSGNFVFPSEVWNYFHLDVPGFPDSLRLLFYKPWGVGDFKLYSPLFDGLELLVAHRHYDFREGEDSRVRNALRSAMGESFLRAAESVTPGYDKMASERVLSTLRNPPEFIGLKSSGKPVVTTYVTYERLPMEVGGGHVRDGRGNFFYDAALSLAPQDITFEKIEDKYYGRADVYVTASDGRGNIVSQFSDQLGLELGEEEYQAKKGYGLTYRFSEVFIPGDYKVKVLLRDYITNRVAEKEMSFRLVPGEPASPVILASRLERPGAGEPSAASLRKPFVYGSVRVQPRVSGDFRTDEAVCFFFEVYPPPDLAGDIVLQYQVLDSKGGLRKTEEERKTVLPGVRTVPVERMFPALVLGEGQYSLEVAVRAEGVSEPLARLSAPFRVSEGPAAPGEFAFENARSASPEAAAAGLGLQSLLAGDLPRAKESFGRALSIAPGYVPARVNLAKCLTLEGDFDGALTALQPLVDDGIESSEVFTILGNIQYRKGDLAKAAEYLEKACDLSLESVDVLNFLGSIYLESGRKDKALETFQKSLAIKADQPVIKSVLDKLGN